MVLLDPADEQRPVGLNLLARPSDSPELVVDQVVSIFHDLYRDSWGPRTDDILRAALLTLVGVPGMTLAEVPLLLTDPVFRRPLVGRINDPVALGPFWGWYDALSDGERTAAIGPVMNKLRTFLLRRRLRNILGQADPVFDFDQALAARSIVLVSLTKGLLGEEPAALLGSLVVTRLWQAVQARAAVPAAQRPATFVPGLPAPAGRGGDDARPGSGLGSGSDAGAPAPRAAPGRYPRSGAGEHPESGHLPGGGLRRFHARPRAGPARGL